MVITSSSNSKIKELKKLKDIKNIKEEKKFIIETPNLIYEAYKKGLLLELITTKEIDIDVEKTYVTKNIIKLLSDIKNPYFMIGICKFPSFPSSLSDKILILDNLSDPGNLGTIIRSASAFNFDTIILSKNCVNPYNSKVIRASQGAFFNVNILTKELISFIKEIKEKKYYVYSTNVNDGTSLNNISNKDKIAVVIGNEGCGVSNEIQQLSCENICIDINKRCESLNASVAASIIMHEFNRR